MAAAEALVEVMSRASGNKVGKYCWAAVGWEYEPIPLCAEKCRSG